MKTKILKVMLAILVEAVIIAMLVICGISSNKSSAYDASGLSEAEAEAFVSTTLDS